MPERLGGGRLRGARGVQAALAVGHVGVARVRHDRAQPVEVAPRCEAITGAPSSALVENRAAETRRLARRETSTPDVEALAA